LRVEGQRRVLHTVPETMAVQADVQHKTMEKGGGGERSGKATRNMGRQCGQHEWSTEAKRATTGVPQVEDIGHTAESGACIWPGEGPTTKHAYYGATTNDLLAGRMSPQRGKRHEDELVQSEWRSGGRRVSAGQSSPAKSLFWRIPTDARLGGGGCRGENRP
jgi:hypothetical protein